jgi:hypothetical protein
MSLVAGNPNIERSPLEFRSEPSPAVLGGTLADGPAVGRKGRERVEVGAQTSG